MGHKREEDKKCPEGVGVNKKGPPNVGGL